MPIQIINGHKLIATADSAIPLTNNLAKALSLHTQRPIYSTTSELKTKLANINTEYYNLHGYIPYKSYARKKAYNSVNWTTLHKYKSVILILNYQPTTDITDGGTRKLTDNIGYKSNNKPKLTRQQYTLVTNYIKGHYRAKRLILMDINTHKYIKTPKLTSLPINIDKANNLAKDILDRTLAELTQLILTDNMDIINKEPEQQVMDSNEYLRLAQHEGYTLPTTQYALLSSHYSSEKDRNYTNIYLRNHPTTADINKLVLQTKLNIANNIIDPTDYIRKDVLTELFKDPTTLPYKTLDLTNLARLYEEYEDHYKKVLESLDTYYNL